MMIKRILIVLTLIWVNLNSVLTQSCANDTIFSDVIFIIDNSQSIDDAEYDEFSDIILATVNKIQARCPMAQVGVVHYGGAFGNSTAIEYPLSNANSIDSIRRQFCTSRNPFGFCNGGGGDDLNAAMGNVVNYITGGTFSLMPQSNLKIVIFTDAFGFDATCTFSNCSVIRPFDNIDNLKENYGADVTVVGVSAQAEASLLAIYASPGGSFSATTLFAPDCPSTYDGCSLPRKYLPIEFNSDVGATSDAIASYVGCQFQVVDNLLVDAGLDQTICSDLGETASLTAAAQGTAPYSYAWSHGLGSTQTVTAGPATTTTYTVSVTDSNGCMESDMVTVTPIMCGPDCTDDTLYTDILFVIDNSQSIDDSEYSAFENIIVESINMTQNKCPLSQVGVVHYGGAFGNNTAIEYPLSANNIINNVNRQYCTSRNAFGNCIGGGGDDLNAAMGNIIGYFGNGSLNHNPSNSLSIVILTDAFGFDATCTFTNCSVIRPFDNIDILKSTYSASVAVIGVSPQAEASLLAIYASPGGNFNSTALFAPDCPSTFDGCQLPRKYIPIDFTDNPVAVANSLSGCITCEPVINQKVSVEAGPDQTICYNFGETANLLAVGSKGPQPYFYSWSHGLGSGQSKTVSPTNTTTYYVTIADANDCTSVDSVTVVAVECEDCDADAGTPLPPMEHCLENGVALLFTDDNIGIVRPNGFDITYVLTDESLTVLNFFTGLTNFQVSQPGIYRIHTLVAETSNPASPDFLDLSIIHKGESDLFDIVNCIENHGVCADFDLPGRVHIVLDMMDMKCMPVENTINLCRDGIDNDGDGLIDCADEDCKELINCLENTLLACNDLFDNDGDGLVDCFDPECWQWVKCFERDEKCDDGIDNDGDGLIDCADDSCNDAAYCHETSAFTCKDGVDNDGDGLIDCQEPSCRKYLVCAEFSPEACRDGKDNDFDGLVDCADGDCKISYSTVCGYNENSQMFCSDGIDNDGDGLIDCDDPQCASLSSCQPESASVSNGLALNITVLLQGAYDADAEEMTTQLNRLGYLPGQTPKTFFGTRTPIGQPYSNAPWFYDGTEGLTTKSKTKNQSFEYEVTVTDWVLVSLRVDQSKESEVWRGAALLHNDGQVQILSSLGSIPIEKEGYFVIVEHRNHLPIMSKHKVLANQNEIIIDFTREDAFTSIIGVGQIKTSDDKFAMIAGNGELITELSSDIDINVRDFNTWLYINGSNSSYFLEDYDLNGDVNIRDRVLWESNNGYFTTLQTK